MKKCEVKFCSRKTTNGRKHCSAHAARKCRYGTLREHVPIGYYFHGHAPRNRSKNSLTYTSWRAMIHRCSNPNAVNFKYYGGRGISFPKRWSDFRNFIQDMGSRKGRHLTLGRKDSSKNYSVKNCRWETWAQQRKAAA